MSEEFARTIHKQRRTDETHLRLDGVGAEVVAFIKQYVAEANAQGVVVGMSGGIDSTLSAMLAVEALGPERVLGLGLPCNKSNRENANEAQKMADILGIEFREVQLRPLLDVFEDLIAPNIESGVDKHAVGNVIARLRMICLYYAANTRSLLVLGTANRTERLLGYFTKHGDGGTDLCPLGNLYKTEVRALAYEMGIPRRIIHKEPTAGFWAGQTDSEELGASYDVIDSLLKRTVDDDELVEVAVDSLRIDRSTADSIVEMVTQSLHKRRRPLTAEISVHRS